MKSLEQLLADLRGDAQVLRSRGCAHDADLLEQVANEVSEAAHEYLLWLTEGEAMLRSGHARSWLRARFAEWERQGHARRKGRERHYRELIVPRRANITAAYEAGKRQGAA